MTNIVDTCPLTKFEGGLNLLHEADDTQSYGWNLQLLQQIAKTAQCRNVILYGLF